ncbi:MAG: cadherin-like beta sandwich domain-containing protein [Candidatus Syntrophosphaera sp.]|nr:cadherin-like beta sandwich domain-containing protein [Candidatus Syntrophosphaera sp.]
MRANKLFLLVIFMMAFTAIMFAQYITVDFEPGGLGADWNWVVGENGANPPLTFPANPVMGGINTTPTVAQFTALDAGMDWALCFTDDIETFQFNASNALVKIMVYKPVISPVAVKFEGGSAPLELQVTNTLVNQWEELTFDFSAVIGNTYSRIVIIPDFAPRNQDNIIYFDNIRIPEGNMAPPTEPTVAAPTPTVDPANVISLFSNAYTNVPVDTWSAGWDMADVADVQIAGNDTKLYTNLVYAGIEFTSQTINATAMTHFHMDIWTPDPTALPAAFRIKLVDFGANGVWGGGDDVEHELSFNADSIPPLVSENWISFDIPLANFINLTTTGHLAQLIISGDPNTVYVDNVYFYDSGAAGSDATLSDLRVDNVTIPGFSPATFNYTYQVTGARTPVVSATKNDPNATMVITQATAVPGTATVVVTAEDGITSLTYTVNFVTQTAPVDAPPVPTHEPEDVISIYSDAYANLPGTNFNPYWGQQTIVTVDVVIAGNNTLLYQNLNYQGTEYTPQDVSAYEYLHVDFWTVNSTDLGIYLISPGAETEYVFTIVPGTWVSVDIPLSYFVPPVNLANVFQFKVEGNGDIWFDNLYFWKNPTAQGTDATLSDLQVDGATLAGFTPLTEGYNYGLLEGTVIVPQITSVTTTDPNATYVITQASGIPGTASVLVTAQNGINTKTYTVAFAITYPNSVPPVPTHNPANVISLFSDAYTDVVVDTWLTPWSQGVYEEVVVAGNPVKKYTLVNFVGIETVGPNLIDVSGMTHVHLDLWTPDANNFRFKLVDWGADGAWSGGDDTEHELMFETPETGSWISYDIPLSAFTGLNITGNMAQYILSKDPLGTMYIDNFYFYAMGLDIPANVTITETANTVTVTWDPVAGATSYTVYASQDPFGTYAPVADGTYNGTSWSSSVTEPARFYYVTANAN